LNFFRSLLTAIRRFFARRAARKLLAQHLPKGLPQETLLRALPEPRLPDDAPAREFWTIPIGRKAPSRLFRMAALPPPPRKLDVLRELPQHSLEQALRLPKTFEIPAPLVSAIADLGAARPRSLRLDDDLRLPTEIDPLRLPADKAPTKTRRVRPRTRNFRLDENSLHPVNEGIVPLEMRDTTYRWIPPAFRRRWLDLHWMAQDRIAFLAPLQTEWFLMWWDETSDRRPGAKEPYDYVLPTRLDWALEAVKEQMLIRRDVKKDENPPEAQEFYFVEVGHPIRAHQRKAPSELVPEKEWVEKAEPLPPTTLPRHAYEAYLQWRTLVDALEER
jgi:hypothetical protein